MDWEREAAREKARADNLQKDLDKCLAALKRHRDIFNNMEHQLFVARSLREPDDKLSKYQYTYP